MSAAQERAVRISIAKLVVSAASSLEAHRLADALPAALARVLGGSAVDAKPRTTSLSERVAHDIAAHIAAATKGKS